MSAEDWLRSMFGLRKRGESTGNDTRRDDMWGGGGTDVPMSHTQPPAFDFSIRVPAGHPHHPHPPQGGDGLYDFDITVDLPPSHGDALLQQFEEQMQRVFGESLGQMFQGFANLHEEDGAVQPQQQPSSSGAREPRDNMLRHPDSERSQESYIEDRQVNGRLWGGGGRAATHHDTDLDSVVTKDNVEAYVRSPEPARPRQSPSAGGGGLLDQWFSRQHSIFQHGVTTDHGSPWPGGGQHVERRRTVRDSDGNTETTVTRALGDQRHTVTVKSLPSGTEERTHSFHNMDEGDLPEFENRWQNRGNSSVFPGTTPGIKGDISDGAPAAKLRGELITDTPPQAIGAADSLDANKDSLFKKFFGNFLNSPTAHCDKGTKE